MAKYIFTLLFLFMVFANLHAQRHRQAGYIVTHKYDTIKGNITYKTDKQLHKVCTFKSVNKDTIFYPGDIRCFHLDDGRYFLSKRNIHEKLFLQVLIDDELDVYVAFEKSKHRYFIELPTKVLLELASPNEVEYFDFNNATNTQVYLAGDDLRVDYEGNLKRITCIVKKHKLQLVDYLRADAMLIRQIQLIDIPTAQSLIMLSLAYKKRINHNYPVIYRYYPSH